jgi:hypothetical protein
MAKKVVVEIKNFFHGRSPPRFPIFTRLPETCKVTSVSRTTSRSEHGLASSDPAGDDLSSILQRKIASHRWGSYDDLTRIWRSLATVRQFMRTRYVRAGQNNALIFAT